MYAMRLCLLIVLALLASFESDNKAFSDDVSSTRSPVYSAEDKGSTAQVKADQARHKTGQAQRDPMSHKWKRETIDTTAGAEYLSEIERQVIIEINKVRTDPAEYARRYLVPLRSYYHDTLLEFPGEIAISTSEGIRALDECIRDLQAVKPSSPLSPRKGLTLAAREHARDQAKTGAVGHSGSDRSTPEVRINRYGKWDVSVGENINYGNDDARRIVTSLLIDDGVPSRGHRSNLLNATFRFVGVAVGPHRVYAHMCVMDFAGSYGKLTKRPE